MSLVYDFFNGHPERWTQGYYARDEDGQYTDPTSEHATCFCIIGAVKRFYPSYKAKVSVLEKLELALKRRGDPRATYSFNDSPTTTFEQVLGLVKEAGV